MGEFLDQFLDYGLDTLNELNVLKLKPFARNTIF
jgi:hypothetical protein